MRKLVGQKVRIFDHNLNEYMFYDSVTVLEEIRDTYIIATVNEECDDDDAYTVLIPLSQISQIDTIGYPHDI
tara:strand:- start:372 stop:587 length:216 start_codon:yes stop_codon:yes gene_type:complete